MNNSLLSTALLTVLATVTYAENTAQPITAPSSTKTPATGQAATPTTGQVAPPATPAIPSSIPMPHVEPPMNCKYHIPAETTIISQNILSSWASKAAVQSFDFNPALIDDELTELKSCYTDQGWQGFNDALKKSGNIEAIKSQHLTVSSQVDGEIKINSVKDNQWKISVPLQVVYQNEKEKLTQLLTVNLLVGRKISGDLGIMQMIATPQQTTNPQQPTENPTSNSTTTPTPSTGAQPSTEQPTTNEQKSANPVNQHPVTFTPPKQ